MNLEGSRGLFVRLQCLYWTGGVIWRKTDGLSV
jgi:hypothetical protein